MTEHKEFKINWVGFPDKKYKVISGVYLIEDFYVGASKNIRSRIIGHLKDSKAKRHSNKSLEYLINKKYSDCESITITLLDTNPFNEDKYLDNYENLVNSNKGRTYNQRYETSEGIKEHIKNNIDNSLYIFNNKAKLNINKIGVISYEKDGVSKYSYKEELIRLKYLIQKTIDKYEKINIDESFITYNNNK